ETMFQHSTQDDLYRSNDAADERLIKIERSWHKRAQIKLDSQRPDIQLDLQAPDFLEALLPFECSAMSSPWSPRWLLLRLNPRRLK
ncbi:hypothetical protein Q6272_29115, partial [Klebsiella pneumoniae]|uniref:hypothetical protein n=1 Tax=Klebsiella pneumoniae TaxID=573 RepID=UPI00272F9AA9